MEHSNLLCRAMPDWFIPNKTPQNNIKQKYFESPFVSTQRNLFLNMANEPEDEKGYFYLFDLVSISINEGINSSMYRLNSRRNSKKPKVSKDRFKLFFNESLIKGR